MSLDMARSRNAELTMWADKVEEGEGTGGSWGGGW
jgi:hypothetical protein